MRKLKWNKYYFFFCLWFSHVTIAVISDVKRFSEKKILPKVKKYKKKGSTFTNSISSGSYQPNFRYIKKKKYVYGNIHQIHKKEKTQPSN